MKSDLEILTTLCGAPPGLKTATIKATDTRHSEAADALAAFLDFPGQGWLCTSEAKEVYLLPDEAPAATEYPLHGERAEGAKSLHLRQDGAGGWILTTLEEVENDGSAICFESELAAYDPELGMLRYQLCHEAVDPRIPGSPSDLSELRPARARFIGFRQVPQH